MCYSQINYSHVKLIKCVLIAHTIKLIAHNNNNNWPKSVRMTIKSNQRWSHTVSVKL